MIILKFVDDFYEKKELENFEKVKKSKSSDSKII